MFTVRSAAVYCIAFLFSFLESDWLYWPYMIFQFSYLLCILVPPTCCWAIVDTLMKYSLSYHFSWCILLIIFNVFLCHCLFLHQGDYLITGDNIVRSDTKLFYIIYPTVVCITQISGWYTLRNNLWCITLVQNYFLSWPILIKIP